MDLGKYTNQILDVTYLNYDEVDEEIEAVAIARKIANFEPLIENDTSDYLAQIA